MLHKSLLLAFTLGASFLATSCTGDPHTGGIFWSEEKAQTRLNNRRDHLDDVESDTDRVQRRNRRLEGAAARRESMLGN